MKNFVSEKELRHIVKQLDAEERITGQEERSEEELTPLSPEDGWIQVKDNQLIVTNPKKGGRFPVLQAAFPVKITINGKVLTDRSIVEESDRIEWEIEKQPLFKIDVTPDRMQVFFRLIALHECEWRLVDRNPCLNVIVEAVEDRCSVQNTLMLTEVIQHLQDMNITRNVKRYDIFNELRNPTFDPVLIAEGQPPQECEDARLEMHFKENVEKNQYEEFGGVIDFRNHLKIPCVKKGDVIAVKIPAREGVDGYDVYGNIIPAGTPKDFVLKARKNVEITPDGTVIAQSEGRPRITGGNRVKYFDVSREYVVHGDVDMKSGNIVFSGDVIVYGNVTDHMVIESLGNVYVTGSVYRATITATGSVIIQGNVIGGQVYSGYFGVVFNRLYKNSKKLQLLLTELLQSARVLMDIIRSKDHEVKIGQVIMTLIEMKYKEIPETAQNIIRTIHQIKGVRDRDFSDLINSLDVFAHPIKFTEYTSLDPIYQIQMILSETYEYVESMQETKVSVHLKQSDHSQIKSNGDIVIEQQGVLQSHLYSNGNIIFKSKDAVIRGGRLEAEEGIYGGNVGGDTGGETLLKAGKMIRIEGIRYGRICVGRFCEEVDFPLQRIKAYVTSRGLSIEKESDSEFLKNE